MVDLLGFHEVSKTGLVIAWCRGMMHNSPRK